MKDINSGYDKGHFCKIHSLINFLIINLSINITSIR